MTVWMGIDVGTSGAKAIVVDDLGRSVAHAAVRYPQQSDGARHEQDGADYLRAVSELVTRCGVIRPGSASSVRPPARC